MSHDFVGGLKISMPYGDEKIEPLDSGLHRINTLFLLVT